jgi:hypothetical protein
VPVVPETELERQIVADPDWQEGAGWGGPRPSHPEGSVNAHVAEVLANVEGVAVDPIDRERLRLVALIHDTFKHRVERNGCSSPSCMARLRACWVTQRPSGFELQATYSIRRVGERDEEEDMLACDFLTIETVFLQRI